MNTFGNLFKVTMYGESHQDAIGVVIDGVMPGILLDLEKIRQDIDLRKPKGDETTPRKESDTFIITSGIFNQYTTGSPLHFMIHNHNIQSSDYQHLKDQPRPNHADFVSNIKYQGFQDYRGGGRFSGRLTLPIVIAGSVAKQMIDVTFKHEIIQIGTCQNASEFNSYLKQIKEQDDTVGGVIKLTIRGLKVGIGEPFFDKLDAKIAQILFSIPTVKGVTFGDLAVASRLGSEYNDIIIDRNGHTKTNHSGGIVGGISNGNDIIIYVSLKPISSIQKSQDTYHFGDNQIKALKIKGRHDVSIIQRVGIVLENAVAMAVADLVMQYRAYEKH